MCFFFFQAEDGIRDSSVTGVQTCALPISSVMAQLTMPLYEGGAIYSQTRQAQQTVGQRRSQVDDARRQAVQTATTAWETLQAARGPRAPFGAPGKGPEGSPPRPPHRAPGP